MLIHTDESIKEAQCQSQFWGLSSRHPYANCASAISPPPRTSKTSGSPLPAAGSEGHREIPDKTPGHTAPPGQANQIPEIREYTVASLERRCGLQTVSTTPQAACLLVLLGSEQVWSCWVSTRASLEVRADVWSGDGTSAFRLFRGWQTCSPGHSQGPSTWGQGRAALGKVAQAGITLEESGGLTLENF